jgi:hypothetical protein
MTGVRTKKVRMPFEQGPDPMFIGEINQKTGEVKTIHLLTLVSFKLENGSVLWSVKDDRGRFTSSGKAMTKLHGIDVHLKPSIPMVVHERQKSSQLLAPEFIFLVPRNLQVYPLSSVRKKYPQIKTSPYRLG